MSTYHDNFRVKQNHIKVTMPFFYFQPRQRFKIFASFWIPRQTHSKIQSKKY